MWVDYMPEEEGAAFFNLASSSDSEDEGEDSRGTNFFLRGG